ncbi:MAG: RHS repeat-associated core domain-containing protein [Deltaproteobacteria bacterium]|nr:RHS repeat-associated core domain-containing protein [Deltaproteobacteria bacterium]
MKSGRFLLILFISFFVLTDRLEARYYDSKTGRFLSEDPIGFEGGDVNLYVYTKNNPINYTDPTGLFVQAIPAICAANPALCISIGAYTIGTIIYYYNNPPLIPSIPIAPPNQPKQCKDDKDGEWCNKIRDYCIEKCSESSLPTPDYGFKFWNCVNACLRKFGCL